MSILYKYNPFYIAALLLCAAVLAVYPYLQYYIDPDAVSYLTVAQRYANGEWSQAVNGYWSPWSCWLTAILIKAGVAPFLSAILINILAGFGVLYVTQSFFIKFNLEPMLQGLMLTALALFLGYATFAQTFADIWEVFFLLACIRLISSDWFHRKPKLWVFTGVCAALAYFAKAYAFPYLIISILACTWYATKAGKKRYRMRWIKICAVIFGTMFILSSPWIYALYNKYHTITTATSGKLNLSWYLVGHPYWADGIKHLLPPVYPDSPFYWEDPFVANGDTPMFYSSPKLFALQIVKLGYNLLKLPLAMNKLNVFFVFIWMVAIGMLLSRKIRHVFCTNKIIIPAVAFLLYPSGFLLINYEPRYLWFMLPLSMLFGGLMMQQLLPQLDGKHTLRNLITILFVGGYLIWPVWEVRTMLNDGKADYEIAQQLKTDGIKGSFACNAVFENGRFPNASRIAYHSGMQYYNMPYANTPYNELLEEMRRYKVDYYLYFYGTETAAQNFVPVDEHGNELQELYKGEFEGLKVFKMAY